MSAQPEAIVRKSAQFEDDSLGTGWFQVPHGAVRGMAWICMEPRAFVLHTLLSMINLRNRPVRKGPRTTMSGGVLVLQSEIAKCSDGAHDLRTIQRTFSYLSEIGAITVTDWKEAQKKGLLTPDEIKTVRQGAVWCTVNIEHFPRIGRRLKKAAAEPKVEPKAEEPVPVTEPPKTFRLTPKPVALGPGLKPETIKLPDEAQKAMAWITEIRQRYDASAHVQVSWSITGNVIEWSASDPPGGPPPVSLNGRTYVSDAGGKRKSKARDKFVAPEQFPTAQVIDSKQNHENLFGKNSGDNPRSKTLHVAIDELIFPTLGQVVDDVIFARVESALGSQYTEAHVVAFLDLVRKDLKRNRLDKPAGLEPLARWAAESVAKMSKPRRQSAGIAAEHGKSFDERLNEYIATKNRGRHE